MIDGTSIGSETDMYPEIANGEMGSNSSSTCDVNSSGTKADGYVEFVDDKMDSSGRTETIDAMTESKGVEDGETVNCEIGTSESIILDMNSEASKKRKRRKKKKKKLVDKMEDIELANSGLRDTPSSDIQMDMNVARSLSEKLTIGNAEILNDQNLLASCSNDFSNHNGVHPMKTDVTKSRKMLLVLDVNGLLADIIYPPPKGCKSDINIKKRAIFKRPFLDDFLAFCFEKFHVAIWSSRTRKILDPVVDYLLGDLKNKLLFLWDLSDCTSSSARSLENIHKFIVFKKLQKIWEDYGPNVGSENGYYDESNTLLLDDSPYKALLNPKHTGIFPLSFSYKDTYDSALGPDGDLRVYLEGVANSENVKMYVEQHPFGQHAIDETSPDWAFYSDTLKELSQFTSPLLSEFY